LRLLVPIDGSNESENALEFAVNLQQKLIGNSNKEIIILNIIPHIHIPVGFERPIRSPKSGETISLSDYIEEMNNTIKLEWIEKLSDIKRKYESLDIKIRTEILVGGASISENIIGFANKENVNMIVIGNIGLGGISKGKALGSVSRKVSEMAKCPVLIVH
jgi:nucleotide-binding universal stress UspA family protein